MIPITVFADLRPPGPSLNSPLLLDTLVSVGLSIWLNRSDPIGHARHNTAVRTLKQPFDVLGCRGLNVRWNAVSQAMPVGPERTHHLHRRAPVDWYVRHRAGGNIDQITGPDKSLRVRKHVWAACRRLRWTALLCPKRARRVNRDMGWELEPIPQLAKILSVVSHVGALSAHGIGWVDGWQVIEGGPGRRVYAVDPTVRHLPIEVVGQPWPPGAVLSHLPLSPPYWSGDNRVACCQVRNVP